MSDPKYDTMSDEDIANMEVPSDIDIPFDEDAADFETNASAEDDEPTSVEQVNPEDDDVETEGDGTLESVIGSPLQAEKADDDDDEPAAESAVDDEDEPEEAAAPEPEKAGKEEAEEDSTEEEPAEAEAATDYEAAYKEIMKPFKANGKMFTPKDSHEAMRLMQMGANYTKRMQALQPSMKILRMLENQGLMDQEKLNFLIDINAKKPEAIAKLLKDGDIDPMDLDVSSESNYRPSNHSVSDQEMTFHSVLEEVQASSYGQEVISSINDDWDQTSKEALYKEPQILQTIATQKENGIYDMISSEIARQRTLGNLTSTSFLDAYKQVGDHLHSQNAFTPEAMAAGAQASAPTPPTQASELAPMALESRPAKAKKAPSSDARAKAAGPAKSTRPAASPPIDVFSLTDEQIEAMTQIPV